MTTPSTTTTVTTLRTVSGPAGLAAMQAIIDGTPASVAFNAALASDQQAAEQAVYGFRGASPATEQAIRALLATPLPAYLRFNQAVATRLRERLGV